MKRAEVEILLTPEAEKEFEEIQKGGRPLVRDWALRYLEDLVLFPPENWVDLRSRLDGGYFKADNHVPFDIRGRVYYGKNHSIERVLITRFHLRKTSIEGNIP
jgi:hypothetical protein